MTPLRSLIIVVSMLCCCHSQSQSPPPLPQAFQCNFTEYTAPQTGSPPYVDGLPSPPFYASRGTTYYDWSRQAMIEVRYDYCVNIFPSFEPTFPCIFHNVNQTSYLISFNTTSLPPCCVFAQPWHPPPPDFLQNGTVLPVGPTPWYGKAAYWYELPDIKPPTGPFFYAFRNQGTTIPEVYLSFSFPGVTGWVQQNFFNVKNSAPEQSVWDVPPQCVPPAGETLPNCGFNPNN